MFNLMKKIWKYVRNANFIQKFLSTFEESIFEERSAIWTFYAKRSEENFCNFAKGMSIEIKNFIRTISEIFNLAQG